MTEAFDRVTVTRGSLVVVSRGITQPLMFNPNDVSDDKEISWGTLQVPGASHPIYQYGAGGERSISFDIYLDGDRGRFGRSEQRDALSIQSHIAFYRSLVYPMKFENATGGGVNMSAVFPSLVIFNFGPMYQSVTCIVKKVSVKINYWTPTLEPVRASIGVQLAEVVTRSQVSQDIFPYFDFE
jgi:hypothetical protein